MRGSKNQSAKAPSQRQMRVAEAIKRSLGNLFIRGDIVLSFNTSLVTVTEVNVSPDLRNSTVYIRSLSGETSQNALYVKELNKNKAQVRYLLAQGVDLQFATDLHFVYDTSLAHALKIDTLLQKANEMRVEA